MHIVITGVAGFVGSAIARRMLAEGHSVVGIDSLTSYYDPKIKLANLGDLKSSKFEFIEGDINYIDLADALDGAEIIFHEAGQPGVRKSWGEEFSEYTNANILATQKLLEVARSISTLRKFVYASSSSLYGDAEGYPTSVEALPAPISPYGVSKLAAEHLCTLYGKNFGVPTVSLRYFTVFGPGQRPDMAFTRFMRAAILDDEIQIFGTGEQIRDFTYIDDVVQANYLAATTDTVPGVVYNVAGGSSISVNDVLKIVAEIHGSPLNVRYTTPVAGDVFQTGGDITSIRRDLNWSSQVDVKEGLKRHYAWALKTFAGQSASL
ncbi:NAD-dependent epimerase/dehydratase family protein [Arthrobacter sp. 4R501]|uniref:NAD-dependent epimerase/dehydratase family protein n=1 Tax=Arthrobacter sp. 4R501 TaxID=2058886 RepID=UPI000CE36B58|nr:NAD-dependent epimerase/dehydratase family protein [Arthrobacter sp. 4R501]